MRSICNVPIGPEVISAKQASPCDDMNSSRLVKVDLIEPQVLYLDKYNDLLFAKQFRKDPRHELR
jgi:hypothetical protein